MLWILALAAVIADTSLSVSLPKGLECQPGWTNLGVSCFRAFTAQLPWDTASRVCEWHGSHLLKVKELDDDLNVTSLLPPDDKLKEFWIALSGSHLTADTVTNSYADENHVAVAVSKCVLARAGDGHVIWALAPCERKSSFICTRPAAPEGCFHCTNEKFVLSRFACDGEDDCGDGSDEIDCEKHCSYLLQEPEGPIFSPGWPDVYPRNARCFWKVRLQLGSNVRLQFTDFSTEPDVDVVTVYVGGPTIQTSRQVARLSGQLNDTTLPTFISDNHFLLLTFDSDITQSSRGFSAVFTTVKATGFSAQGKRLTATPEVADLFSPFYPSYLAWQDYTWVITADKEDKTITLEIVDVNLTGRDKVLLRDGETAYGTLLTEVTSSTRNFLPYVLTTGRHLYITMQTRGPDVGKGFHFRYWQGCSVKLNAINGTVHSPGYRKGKGHYGLRQSCIFDVTIPQLQTVTIQLNHVDLDDNDYLLLYDSDHLLLNVTRSPSLVPFDVSSGRFRVIFESDDSYTSNGFSLTFSISCPKLQLDSHTLSSPQLYVYRFGAKVVVSCADGYSFHDSDSLHASQDTPSTGSLELECLEGGVWSVTELPSCKLQCPPGSYRENVSQQCEECDKGQYQPSAGATSCQECPAGTTTEASGSRDAMECKLKCQAGYFYNRSAEGCSPCPQGYYQDTSGHFFCMPCPPHTSTAQPGSNSSRLCFDDRVYDGDLESQGLVIVDYHHDTVVKTLARKSNAPHRLFFLSDITSARRNRSRDPDHSSTHARHERSVTVDAEDLIESGCGSGEILHCDDMQASMCNDTQDCLLSDSGSPYCKCKPIYWETSDHHCVPYEDGQMLYLTTPLGVPFNKDLNNKSGISFKTFQRECQDTFVDIFKIVEAYKYLGVLEFRSANDNAKTVVVFALLCSTNITNQIVVRVAQIVLSLENNKTVIIGNQTLGITSHIGIFTSLSATNSSHDAVDWCNEALSPSCPPGEQCVDTELRYFCAPVSSDPYTSKTGAIAGGVIGAFVAVVLISVLAVFIVKKRRKSQEERHALRSGPRERQFNTYTSTGVLEIGTERGESREDLSADELNPYDVLLEGFADGRKNTDKRKTEENLYYNTGPGDQQDRLGGEASGLSVGDYEQLDAKTRAFYGEDTPEHTYTEMGAGAEETSFYESLGGGSKKRESEHVYTGLGRREGTFVEDKPYANLRSDSQRPPATSASHKAGKN